MPAAQYRDAEESTGSGGLGGGRHSPLVRRSAIVDVDVDVDGDDDVDLDDPR